MYANTAQEMYELTLELLNKEGSSSLSPTEWHRLANQEQINYVNDRYAQFEQSQRSIDDLNTIIRKEFIINTGAAVAGQEIFVLPYNTVPVAPLYTRGYFRMLNVRVELNYINDKCFPDGIGDNLVGASPLKSDSEVIIEENPYKRSKASRLHYDLREKNLYLETGEQTYGTRVQIKYLRYPREIDLANSGSFGDCELPLDSKTEICNQITKTHIENIESGRYPTMLNELKSIVEN